MMTQTRRRFLMTLSLAGAAGLLRAPPALTAERPLETNTVRLQNPALCVAPLYVAEELLRAEGFTDIRYVVGPPGTTGAVARGEVDFGPFYASQCLEAIDAGEPITLLAGVMAGCFELFANEGIRSIADRRPQGHRPLRRRAGSHRAADCRRRFHRSLRLCLADAARNPVRPMAGVRRRGHDPVLCPAPARRGLHQIDPAEDHRRRHRLAFLERAQTRAEGLKGQTKGGFQCR